MRRLKSWIAHLWASVLFWWNGRYWPDPYCVNCGRIDDLVWGECKFCREDNRDSRAD